MTDLRGKEVLITGAAHGIGAAFAKLLAKEGCHLLLIDIDEAKLNDTANAVRGRGVAPNLMVKDLSRAEERESVFSSMAKNNFHLDILINNVSLGYWRHFRETPWEKLEYIIDLNVKCMTHMTKLALPGMLSRNEGYIVNLSSTAAFIGTPNGVCYSGTKAYIRIFSESLEMELVNTGVKVLCVFPGPTDTNFWKSASMVGGKYDKKIDKMTPEDVAQEAIVTIKAGRSTVVPGLRNKFNMLCVKFLPREILKKVALKRFEG